MGITTVLLDVDGTMVNTIDLAVEVLREAVHETCGRDVGLEELRPLMHLPSTATVKLLAPDGGHRLLSAWTNKFDQRFAECYVYDGVREGLRRLQRDGLMLAAVTAETRPELDRLFAALDLAQYFRTSVTVDEVEHPKPAPDSLERALALLGSSPEEAVFIGDSPSDIVAARAAGVRSVAALWGGQPAEILLAANPDYAFQTFADCVDWVVSTNRPSR